MIEIKVPLCSLVEDYLKDIFNFFNAKLDPTYKVNIFIGRKSGSFEHDVKNTAVFNLYAVKTDIVQHYNNRQGQDRITFYIDVFVAPKNKNNDDVIKAKYQDEAAHKSLLLYTNYCRSLLTDLSTKRFGLPPNTVANFRFNSIASFDNQYTDSEITMLGARIEFSLDMAFVPTDSNEYNRLSAIFLGIKTDEKIEMLFDY